MKLNPVSIWGASIEPQSGTVWILECANCAQDLMPLYREQGANVPLIGVFISPDDAVTWLITHGFKPIDFYVWKEQVSENPRYAAASTLPLYTNFGTEHEKMETLLKLNDIFVAP